MTNKEQVIDRITKLTDRQFDRLCELFVRFNWDTKAILEYLQNEREETA